jgi:hypothetical protein
MFANLDAGSTGRDRFELAAILHRRVGLKVEAILLSEAAGQEYVNGGAGLDGWRLGGERTQLGQVIHAQFEKTDAASFSKRSGGTWGLRLWSSLLS